MHMERASGRARGERERGGALRVRSIARFSVCKESGASPWCSNHPQAELAPAVGHGKIRNGGGCVCVCVCDRGQYAELVFSLKPSECEATAVGCRDLQVCMFVCGQNARPVFS